MINKTNGHGRLWKFSHNPYELHEYKFIVGTGIPLSILQVNDSGPPYLTETSQDSLKKDGES